MHWHNCVLKQHLLPSWPRRSEIKRLRYVVCSMSGCFYVYARKGSTKEGRGTQKHPKNIPILMYQISLHFVPRRASIWWAKGHASSVTCHLCLHIPLSTGWTSIKILSIFLQPDQISPLSQMFPPPHHSCKWLLVLLRF